MKDLRIAAIAACLTAAAAGPLFAGPRRCFNGLPPKLSGDIFSPVECSTTTKPSPPLPGLPVVREGEIKTDLKDLNGRWEGILIHGLGRYELLLTVRSGWGGKAEVILEIKEQQFHERLTDRLSLTPGKERGTFEATLTATPAPEAALNGHFLLGAAVPPEGSVPTPDRQADIAFNNGAAHRVYFAVRGDSEMRVRAFSGIPGAKLQKFELTMTRTKRKAL